MTQLSFTDSEEVAKLRDLLLKALWLIDNSRQLTSRNGREQERLNTRNKYIQDLTDAGYWKGKHGKTKKGTRKVPPEVLYGE